MKYFNVNLFIFLTIICFFNVNECKEDEVVAARIESCRGCALNRLPEVKQFIYEDIPKYNNVEFKPIHGAKPELLLLNENDDVLERIKLEQYSRQQCNEILQSKGFSMKRSTEEL